jgi:hypothetical protein
MDVNEIRKLLNEKTFLEARLAKLLLSYNPELPMGPGMTAQFEEIRSRLVHIYEVLEA